MTEHPSRDQLADLVVDELPVAQARLVEAHVMACASCADIVTATEQVREVLRADVVQMPDAVWHRLHLALSEAGTPASGVAAQSPFRETSGLPETTALIESSGFFEGSPSTPSAAPAAQWQAADDDAPTQQWQAFVDEPPVDRLPHRGLRSGVSRQRSRRDIREENRHATLTRYGKPLSIAAGVLVAAGLGVTAIKGLVSGATAGEASSAGVAMSSPAAAASAPTLEGAVIRTSGTDYTNATVARLAVAQLATTNRGALAAGGSADTQKSAGEAPIPSASGAPSAPSVQYSASQSPPASSAAAASREVSPVASPGSARPSSGFGSVVADTGTAAPLSDPAALQACLKLLGAPAGAAPLLVDLARFEGKDAAIIVLQARDGGYEVWAVARDCHAQYSYTAVPAG